MFLEYYKLRDQPFGVTPDPHFLYFGSTHREALASLLYSIEAKRGFSAMVAEPGMGKTTLLFRLLEMLRGSSRTAFLFQNEGDSRDLLRSVLNDLGIPTQGRDLATMHEDLNSVLLEEMRAGRQVIVVLDEAQNLDEKSLESVRLLSNFETATQKLMHIVLAGQPGLGEKLAGDSLKQLRQRVSTIIRLDPFTSDETGQYIDWRLRAAGYEGPQLFSSEALAMITRASKGIPRNINGICFQALSIGFAIRARVIGSEIVREVVFDLDPARKSSYRVSEQAPVAQPEPLLFSQSALGASAGDSWAYIPSISERSGRTKGIAILACAAIPLLLFFIFSDPKLGLTKTPPGRVSSQVVNAVLNSRDSSSDFVPTLPSGLKPPSAPSIEAAIDPLAAPPNDELNAEGPDDVHNKQIAVDSIHPETGLDLVSSKSEKVAEDEDKRDRSLKEERRTTSLVQASRRENLFEFALENYGKSSRDIVDDICKLNPQINGPFEMLSAGQWLQLPDETSAFTSATEPHSANIGTSAR